MMNDPDSSQILVIGYGNTLRKDDGIGRYLVEQLSPQADLKILSVHQLTPELAADIAEVKGVIFVDVVISSENRVQTQALTPNLNLSSFGHSLHPEALLSLTQTLYQTVPRAWWVLIPGEDFTFGETFSSLTQTCIPEGMETIKNLIETLKN